MRGRGRSTFPFFSSYGNSDGHSPNFFSSSFTCSLYFRRANSGQTPAPEKEEEEEEEKEEGGGKKVSHGGVVNGITSNHAKVRKTSILGC